MADKESSLRKIAVGVAISVLTAIALAVFQPAMVASWLAAGFQWLMGLAHCAWSALSTPVPLWSLLVGTIGLGVRSA